MSQTAAKRTGKENAPPPRSAPSKSRLDEGDDFDDMDDAYGKSIKSSTSSSDTSRQLKQMTSERDRLRKERDTFAKQFEELSRLRNTASESLYDRYKEKATLQAKAQSETIASLTALNDSLQAKVGTLEAALKEATAASISPAPVPAEEKTADAKEVAKLKEAYKRLKADFKAKEEQNVQLKQELKAEIEHSKAASKLSASTSAAPAQTAQLPEEVEKNEASLRLYEDLTDLQIYNVHLKHGEKKSSKETTYNCVQTIDGRTLNFKLRLYTKASEEKIAAKADNPWVKYYIYTPELGLGMDPAFREKLDIFATSFTIEADQVASLWSEMKRKMASED